MSLHSIVEPAGTLVHGWKLVPTRDPHAADLRNEDDIPLETASAPAPPENLPAINPASRWEAGKAAKSDGKMGKIG